MHFYNVEKHIRVLYITFAIFNNLSKPFSFKMSTSESNEMSIANLNDGIESSIAISESLISDVVSSVLEKEMLENTFSKRLDEDFDQREKSGAKSFKLFFDMAIFVLKQNSLSLRDLILYIEEKHYANSDAIVDKSGLAGKDRLKLRTDLRSKTSDFICTMGNKILQFLHDLKEHKAHQNMDYISLLNTLESVEKQTVMSLLESLLQSSRFNDLIIPQGLAEEKLYLSLKTHRKGLLKLGEVVLDTIKSKASDPEIIDLTLDDFPGHHIKAPQIERINQLFLVIKRIWEYLRLLRRI